MPSLDAIFRLQDKYSSTIDKVMGKTDKATAKIMKASGETDKFNNKLSSIGVGANKASSGLGKLITVAATYIGSLKGMDIADNYTNTAARLNLINDGLQTQQELQNKIFASADRARGSYSSIADAVAKLNLLAGDAFGSNGEAIAFTELMQKSFKLGGADTSTQQSAMRQLTQAMASGRLQGDELVSIMEGAPMLYDAIAKYMGKSKGELKELGSEGKITADIIKNALFSAGDDINAKFETLPKTFADMWTKMKNDALKAFRPLMTRLNNIINSKKFDDIIDKVSTGLYIAANAADKALDVMVDIYDYTSTNWSKIAPIIEAATAAWLAYKAAVMLVSAVQWAAALANPVSLTLLFVVVLAAAFVYLWEKSEKFRKLYVAMWKSGARVTIAGYNSFALTVNLFKSGYNMLIDSVRGFVKALKNGMIAAVLLTSWSVAGMIASFGTFIDVIGKAIEAYNLIAKAKGMKTIDFNINTKGLLKQMGQTTGKAIGDINKAYGNIDGTLESAKSDKYLKLIDSEKFGLIIDYIGDKMEDFTVSGWLEGLFSDASAAIKDLFPNEDDEPYTVQGMGPGGSIPVNMSDEDLQYLRDIAEREYINKFSTATLAPNVVFNISDIKETADLDALKGRLEAMMREEIALTAEGVY